MGLGKKGWVRVKTAKVLFTGHCLARATTEDPGLSHISNNYRFAISNFRAEST